ncbi:MAG: hypothetical protein CBE18_00020 [Pelagibacteraceae bacterium TMED258]|mgnify:FL=1|nr:MAG: hypothetical protein CBE18_00020 [Pelagibacteraceae bacterium TMED258]|tara:strand:- start:646 stop:942 length:297 start_codon:yes stop_codon:yes gene_type:complete
MNKDNFYYVLKERLEYVQEYLADTNAFIKSVKFQDNVEKEFFKNKILLYLIIGIINIPSDILKYYQYLISVFNYKRAQNEINILRKELSKYEQNNYFK